ncbi:MAG: ATP-binding cassette domain-containing protein [Candidatus Woesearchaeota archaeon]|jgi:ABC-2 type transport system ATP-binding protein
MKKPVIHVKNLKKDYYQYKVFSQGKLLTKALRDIAFDIYPGDFVGLIGVNGAGKSTLMRILTTNMEKSSGTVQIFGLDIDKKQDCIKEQISWMFGQDYSGIGWASVEKNMNLAAAFLGMNVHEAQNRIEYLLKKFNLTEKRTTDVWRLSTGMVAKYSLAVALLKNPKVLFLDEPLMGLDTYAKDEIRAILKELNEKGTTIVYTDHQLHEVERICKRLLIINEGKLLFDGSVKKLKQVYRDTNVLEVICTGKNLNKIMYGLVKSHVCLDYEVIESEGKTHIVRIYTAVNSKKKLVEIAELLQKFGIIIDQLNAGLLSLEDVYRKFLKKDKNDQAKKLEYFGKANEEPLAEFEKLLKHVNPKVRSQACRVFWKNNKLKVEPILINMLSGTKQEQQEALYVIGQIKDKSFTKHVLVLLDQKEILTKNYAVIALAKLGNETIIDPLMKLLLDQETAAFVLEHVLEFENNILEVLQEKIHTLSGYDKVFIQHQCQLMEQPKKLLDALHLQHRDYHHWKREKLQKGVN